MPQERIAQFLKPQEVIAKCQIKEGMHVADLGCGNLGYFIIPIARLLGKSGQAYAVDILKTALEGVRSKAKLEGITNLTTVWANLEKIGSTAIPKESLDLALLINVLFQNKDHQSILKEASRLVKKQGRLIIVDWKKVGVPFGPELSQRIDANEIQQIASKLKLQVVEEIEFGQYFWGLILQKP